MPTGTIGAPVRADRKAAPSMRSSITGPARRVPSGKSTRTSPLRSTSSARWSASRSADSRWTGKAPTSSSSLPSHLFFHISSLVMKNSLRSVQKAANPKSANERCTGARITGPVSGTCSVPVTLGRNQVHRAVTKMARSARYSAVAPRVDLEGLVPARRRGRTAPSPPSGVAPWALTATTAPPRRHPARCGRSYRAGGRRPPRRSGEASRVESIRSRRATPSGASSSAPAGPLLGGGRQVHLELRPRGRRPSRCRGPRPRPRPWSRPRRAGAAPAGGAPRGWPPRSRPPGPPRASG